MPAFFIADVDRGYYRDHVLRVARHPSETDERMMIRLLAFALHADDALEFGRGLSNDDEPDLWKRDLTGAIETWIDVGLPDERELRKACGRAREVFVLAYGGRAVELVGRRAQQARAPASQLHVSEIPIEVSRALSELADRSTQLQVTIQEGHAPVANGDTGSHGGARGAKAAGVNLQGPVRTAKDGSPTIRCILDDQRPSHRARSAGSTVTARNTWESV